MRRYLPKYDDIGISRERYIELLHFCRQYPEWIKEASQQIGGSGHGSGQGTHGSGSVSDPVFAAVQRREKYLDKIQMVHTSAMEAGGAEWYGMLISNICYGVPLASLDPTDVPTSNRNAYYAIKKRFFGILDIKKR